MRCTWFPKASCITRRIQKTTWFINHAYAGIAHKNSAFAFQKSASTFALATPAGNNAHSDAGSLTPAQLSRIVWQSVRLATQAQDLQTAYIIVESARLSNKPLLHNSPSKAFLATGIQFHQPVSQRLTGHALIHGLLRLGLPRKAHAAAKIMIDNGVPIRTKTFELLLRNLVASDGTTPRSLGVEFLNLLQTILPKPNVLSLHPSLTGGKGSRAALDLFTCARNSKQQHRTERMYRTIIGSFLLHGELIAASLLITVILKDCAVREALARQLEFKEDPEIEQQTLDHYRRLRRSSPYPSFDILKDIFASIAQVLSKDPVENDAYQVSFRAALQALANLAYILDIRQIPYPHLSSLLRLLYSCPKCDDLVWVVGKDHKPVQTKAYDYFHLILERFAQNPPRYRTQPLKFNRDLARLRWNPSLENTRPLDLPACNSLLHYALRHRLSPNLANSILLYMQDPFWKEMKQFRQPVANEVTYNVILTAGRLLRSPIMAETVLQMFQGNGERGLGNIHSSPPVPSYQPIDNLDLTQGKSPTRFSQSLRRLASESHSLSLPSPNKSESNNIHADSYTLSSYISYLTSTGRPHIVPDILFSLLPELTLIDHPSWGSLPASEIKRIRRESRETSLRRLVLYGPHFFVSVLNAVVKAGKTGLAERVWLLAKEAERASWLEEFHRGKVDPWCLPVHAYTLMLVCYGDEACKSSSFSSSSSSFSSSLSSSSASEAHWRPRSNSKRFVVGWAHYISRRNARMGERQHFPLSRSTAGRESGVSVYHSMLRGARSVYQAFQGVVGFNKSNNTNNKNEGGLTQLQLDLPVPDARFFNAMLRILTRNNHHHRNAARPRRAHTRPSHWRQHIRFADWLYRKYGQPLSRHNPDLVMVAEDMVRAGLEIPVGVRYLLVGQEESLVLRQGMRKWREDEKIDNNKKKVKKRMRGPWAYPVKELADSPFALSVVKQKGLPIGRVSRKRGRRSKKKTRLHVSYVR